MSRSGVRISFPALRRSEQHLYAEKLFKHLGTLLVQVNNERDILGISLFGETGASDDSRLLSLRASFAGYGWARLEADVVRFVCGSTLGLDLRPTVESPDHVVLFVKSGAKLSKPARNELATHATAGLLVVPGG